jgi:hypothetical protein
MRVGDLFQYKTGFIRSLSYDWNYLGAGGKWELTKGVRMPQGVNVQMSYQVIHETVPDRDYNFYSGPAGGVGGGMKDLRELDYMPTVQGSGGGATDLSGSRYIPAGTNTTLQGERGYLDHVDNIEQTRNSEQFET